jgi:uncharacterized protein (TIGR02453 family)
VKGPSGAFVVSMGAKLKAISPAIKAIPKVNQSLFRVNRDTRFSADKSPYKTNLGIWFWEGEKKRMECPGFYFHLDTENLMLGGHEGGTDPRGPFFSRNCRLRILPLQEYGKPIHEWLRAAMK